MQSELPESCVPSQPAASSAASSVLMVKRPLQRGGGSAHGSSAMVAVRVPLCSAGVGDLYLQSQARPHSTWGDVSGWNHPEPVRGKK